jgi:hypothetical protein
MIKECDKNMDTKACTWTYGGNTKLQDRLHGKSLWAKNGRLLGLGGNTPL